MPTCCWGVLTMATDAPARRTFGPVALGGVASATLAAVAGHQPWARADGGAAAESALIAFATESGPGESPVAGALALVALACWGVILVSRGRFRRVAAGLAVLAGLGVLAAVVIGYGEVPAAVRDAVAGVGVADPDVSRTPWYWVAGASAIASVCAAALAVRWAPAWPEMGQRYDAPPGPARRPAEQLPTERADTELWKALDDGRDPTL